eukprot:4154982-Heterocapsa_arctica.AAC.1
MQYYLAGIFQKGLLPGGDFGKARRATNFNAYLPSDIRNVVGGRKSEPYDAILVFDTARLLQDHK